MKRVYVLIVNWNGWGDTIECLESVFRLDYPDYRVIVCDNGSTDDSHAQIVDWAEGHLMTPVVGEQGPHRRLSNPPIEKPISYTVYDRQQAEEGGDRTLDPRLILIQTGGNLGFAGGNNVGLRYALERGDFDYVWLLNNDTVVDPQSLMGLVARMADKPSAGMCGSTLLHYERPGRVQACGGGYYCQWIGLPWHIGQSRSATNLPSTEHVERWMSYVVGASLLVSRDFLEQIGLMCEDYFLFFEEVDWMMRSKGHFAIAYAQDSIVFHKIGRSIGTSSNPLKKSAVCDYYAIRNRLLFTRRYCPAAFPVIIVLVLAASLLRLMTGRVRRARMTLALLFGNERLAITLRDS
jgi:hypothetical protein